MDGTHLWNLDGTYNIWMEPEHTQNGWNLFMFPNPTPDTLNWSVMHKYRHLYNTNNLPGNQLYEL